VRETQRGEISRDALAKLVVDKVLESCRAQLTPANPAGEDWFATQAFTPASTFAC
jgi:hypothetical protein